MIVVLWLIDRVRLTLGTSSDKGRNRVPLLGPPTCTKSVSQYMELAWSFHMGRAYEDDSFRRRGVAALVARGNLQRRHCGFAGKGLRNKMRGQETEIKYCNVVRCNAVHAPAAWRRGPARGPSRPGAPESGPETLRNTRTLPSLSFSHSYSLDPYSRQPDKSGAALLKQLSVD